MPTDLVVAPSGRLGTDQTAVGVLALPLRRRRFCIVG